MEGVFQAAARRMLSRETPLNQAVEVAWARSWWAWIDSSLEACGEMRLTIHLDKVSFEAGLKGDLGIRNSLSEERMDLVLSRYHFKALTGQTLLSSWMEDNEEMFGR